MPSYTYPVAHPEGQLTTDQIHLLLSNERVIARRVADITKLGFIADFLLQDRLPATGGGVFYETGASDSELYADADAIEAVEPLMEYPETILAGGEIAGVKTTKWGLGTRFSDEKIAREGISYVNRGLQRLGNTVIRHVDGVAMAVIASKVTSNFAAPSAWSTAGKVAEHLFGAQQARANLGTGLNLDTVVLPPAKWAKLIGLLIDDKALPREQGNIVVTGREPVDALGFTWVTSPQFTGSNPLLVDRTQLGGMADEDLGSPGYSRGSTNGPGVESKSKYDDDTEGYKVRARRVTVPVVLEPLAGGNLTGTGL